MNEDFYVGAMGQYWNDRRRHIDNEYKEIEDEMRKAGARWTILAFGGVVHSFTDPAANRPPSSQYSAHASHYGYGMAHGMIADAFAGMI